MKNLMLILTFLVTSVQMESCATSDEAVKAVVDEFVQAMYKPVDFDKMKELYTGIEFSSVKRADAHEIKSMEKKDGAVIANIHSYWTKSTGEKVENDFKLKLEKQGEDWKIVNSKDLARENTMYPDAFEFGVKNGSIVNPDEMWDFDMLQAIKKARAEMKKQ